ncbi:MAG: hypothetical protein OEM83_07970 [Gammaproteobacteria bacterium]|nr:hypothetical protein [Gammaproteobacteria bacterium]
MGLLLTILVIVAAVAAFLWYRQRSAAPTGAPPAPSNRFHAVTIHIRADACPAVRVFASTKFLAKEAPRLPLENCTAPVCKCRYEHYDDRRTEEDRRESADAAKYEGEQKRTRKDRRRSRA